MSEPTIPGLRLAFTAWFEIGPPQPIGDVPGGAARVIPITGGWFRGDALSGVVMDGGSDWQTVRPDGVTVLEARYGLKTDDDVILKIHNHVLVRTTDDGERFIRGRAEITAPAGKYDWLNKSVFITTLNAPGDDTAPVVIRYFEVI